MLLDNNTIKTINLLDMFDNLNNIDKIRLAIYLLENKSFDINFNVKDIIILLKEVLNKLDSSYRKTIVNFDKYKHLMLVSTKYLELFEKEKKNFLIKMLFNIFETDFKNKVTNRKINKHLDIYDYCYSLLNNKYKTPSRHYCLLGVFLLNNFIFFYQHHVFDLLVEIFAFLH